MPLDEHGRYDLDPPAAIGFRSLRGSMVVCRVTQVSVSPERVDIVGSVPFSTWMSIVRDGAFHVDLDYGELDERETDVDVELMLRPAFAYDFSDGDGLVAALAGEQTSLLHQTEAWLLGSATQSVLETSSGDHASIGYRTRWARPLV